MFNNWWVHTISKSITFSTMYIHPFETQYFYTRGIPRRFLPKLCDRYLNPCLMTMNVSNPSAALMHILEWAQHSSVGSHRLSLVSIKRHITSWSLTSFSKVSTSMRAFSMALSRVKSCWLLLIESDELHAHTCNIMVCTATCRVLCYPYIKSSISAVSPSVSGSKSRSGGNKNSSVVVGLDHSQPMWPEPWCVSMTLTEFMTVTMHSSDYVQCNNLLSWYQMFQQSVQALGCWGQLPRLELLGRWALNSQRLLQPCDALLQHSPACTHIIV
jgi:hypothetical protein